MKDVKKICKIAVIQAAPVMFDKDACTHTDDELVAMSKESMKELKATAASVSIADAESRAAK